METLLGNMEGASLPGTLRESWISRGWDVEGFVNGFSVGVPLGNLGMGSVYREL